MKKLFAILLSAILLFASCAKIEDMSVKYAGERTSIAFNTAAATKAIVEGTDMVDHFGVYGYVVPGNYSSKGYLMKNAEYEETGDAANGAAYYWPISDNPNGIDFIFTAYSQYDENVVWENDSLKVTVPVLTQALIDNPDDFNDVLWAQVKVNRHQDNLEDHERVALNFKHALSWLQFRGEVTNPAVKWVKVKSISFGEFVEGSPAVPGTPEIPAYNDTTDTWVNLKNNGNVVATSTQTKAPGATSYVNAYTLPEDLVVEIKSYYSVDDSEPGDYQLKLGKSAWDPINNTTATIKKLRVVKEIPAEYKMTVDMHGEGIMMDFFDAMKYLSDNGYAVNSGTTGGKPQVFSNNYVILDAYVNGAAYTVTALNWGEAFSVPEYTIVEHEAVPGTPDIPAVPNHSTEGLYVGGELVLPTDTLAVSPVAAFGAQKDTSLNYVKAQVDTIFTNDHIILGNALIVPQEVPQNITVVFDICIGNETGDDIIFTDRIVTKTINAGKDMEDVDYVALWTASNKYIYNFRFGGDLIDFNATVSGWTLGDNNYHVWNY